MFNVVISGEFLGMVRDLGNALASEQTEEAERLDGEIRATIQPVQDPGARMEILGVVAQSLKLAGQFEGALPYFRELCLIASVHAPADKNSAWDFRHYAECLRAVGQDEEAAEWDERSMMIGLLYGGI